MKAMSLATLRRISKRKQASIIRIIEIQPESEETNAQPRRHLNQEWRCFLLRVMDPQEEEISGGPHTNKKQPDLILRNIK